MGRSASVVVRKFSSFCCEPVKSQNHTRINRFLVSFRIRSSQRSLPQNATNFGFGTLGASAIRQLPENAGLNNALEHRLRMQKAQNVTACFGGWMGLLIQFDRLGSDVQLRHPLSKPILNIRGPFLTSMGNRPDRARTKAPRRARKHKDLLAIWLDLLKQVDNPPRRRAAKLRRTQRPRRPIPLQRVRLQVYGSRSQANGDAGEPADFNP